jgi:hypothetical protein
VLDLSIYDCISQALNSGRITREEAEDLRRRWEALEGIEGTGVNGPERISERRARLVSDLREEALEKRRANLLAVKAKDNLDRDIRRYQLFNNGANIVKTGTSFFEHFGDAGFQSVRQIQGGLLGAAQSEMAGLLRTFRRSALTMARKNKVLLQDVARAAWGENVSEQAQALYRMWSGISEKLRVMFNDAGGHIGWLKDWGLPMWHDAGALVKAGFEKWRSFIEPRLDWEKMAHSVSGAAILPEEHEAVLKHVYDRVVSDGWNKREPNMSGGAAALYNRRSDPRFLIFKDSQSWLDYNTAFGSGDVFITMMRHVRSLTRDIGLMQRFGPNPAAMVNYLKQVIDHERGKFMRDEPSFFRQGSKSSAAFEAETGKRMIDGLYDQARGGQVPSSPAGHFFAIFRNIELGAKIGSAIDMHLSTNPVFMAYTRRLTADKGLRTFLDYIRSFTDKHDIQAAGMLFDDAMTTLDRGAREVGAWQKIREWSNWLPTVTSHYSGLDLFVNASRRTGMLGQMMTAARHLDKSFDELPARYRTQLMGNGLYKDDWERLRQSQPYDLGGLKVLRYQDIANIDAPPVERTANEAVAQKYNAVLLGTIESLVPSSNWSSKAYLLGGKALEGNIRDEALKSAMMFKGGFATTAWLSQRALFHREAVSQGRWSATAHMAAFMTTLTMGGAIGLQLKQMQSGKDFLDMNPLHPEGRMFWFRAFLSCGALGLYGDFLSSEFSSYDHHWYTDLAGPVISGLTDFLLLPADLAGNVLHAAGLKKDNPNTAGAARKFLQNNTPLLSTHWALRAAYNRVLLDQMQYAADPEAHRKMRAMQDRVMRETGQGFWWQPGQALPGRLPTIAMPKR